MKRGRVYIKLILLILFLGLIIWKSKMADISNPRDMIKNEEKEFKKIDLDMNIQMLVYDEYKRMIEEQKTFIVYYYFDSCPDCLEFKPILNDTLLDLDIKIYSYDTMMEGNNKNDIFDKIDLNMVPTIIFYKKGAEEKRIEDVVEKNELIKFFEEFTNDEI